MKTINMIQKLAISALLPLALLSVNVQAEETEENVEVQTPCPQNTHACPAQETQNSQVSAAKKAPKPAKQKYAGWYMRVTASATADDGTVYAHNTAGVFGELVQSKLKKDRHDIPSYGAAAFQVVFPHYDWADESGDYWSDYRKYNPAKSKKRAVYTFQIKNQNTVDLSNASLKLSVEGAQNVNFYNENGQVKYVETDTNDAMLGEFTLVDVDKHTTYSIEELENADLSMDGNHTRTFRMVLGKVRDADFNPVVKPQ